MNESVSVSVYNGYHINLKKGIISYFQTSYYLKEMKGCLAVYRSVIRSVKWYK
jgi:hypothetical protein